MGPSPTLVTQVHILSASRCGLYKGCEFGQQEYQEPSPSQQRETMSQSDVNLSSQSVIIVTENIRRSANYKPNIWKYDFLQSLVSKYDKEEFVMQLNKRVMEVKGLFVEEAGVLKKLELVDWIQKLGLANYFQKEINDFLESILAYVKNSHINPSVEQNLHVSALCFRLLRQHGYPVLPDILSSFLDEKGKVMRKSSYVGYAKDVVELLEASHLGLEGEKILDEAKTCAIKSLKDAFSLTSINVNQVSTLVVEKMVHALELPSHWRVPWFDVKWHVEQYKKDERMEPILLELAKLNFNTIQATLQLEVKELSRWWENLGIKKELSFARNRLVESFMCAAGVAFEPKYKSVRKWLTKVIIFVLVIDDVYDIHASFEELKPFTMAFERWDDKELEELPEYMRICFHALKDATNEIAYEIGGENNFHLVFPYLKKAWIDFCEALYVEAKWYNKGYIPSLQEYLSNAWISSSGPVILLHSYFATMHQVTDAIDDFLHTYEDLIYNVSLVIRLCNDLGTTVAERERGDAASSVLCYMNQMNTSEEKARKHIQYIIHEAWKKINGHCSSQVASVEPFLTQVMNAARVAHTLYQNGDGFGIQDRDIKKHILSLVVEPL
ncbi:Alpha-farnesene synthase [Spatholobus suberectus]|nr:Alpha-farnesene synthase [Spatholobus suberectus]